MYNADTDPLFKRSRLLKFQDLYTNACLKFYHKYTNHSLPAYFDSMFDNLPVTHTYETRFHNYRPQVSQKRFTSKCIRYIIPRKVIDLPRKIFDKLHTHSLHSFGNFVKYTLYSAYKESCDVINCYICAQGE